ncbi:cystatin-C-like [Hippoglossus hippoglossus]|uniref:cystatin-C-like n=1 Tax=Hippoglossus hippoglossus TaxID=8267 RepID=UPI00148E1E22|nr:cystatin-C-like [Hippoglossus hippoglossus]XP_035027997.1 cystatin-C [Hippoglossus stenolepis]
MNQLVFPVLAALFAVGLAGLGGMVGAPADVDISDAQDFLDFAVVQHNRGSNDMFLSQVAKVIKVQRQVVSGSLYIITVQMGKTPCRKGSADEVCAIYQDQASARPYICTFKVWSRPWLNDTQLVGETC